MTFVRETHKRQETTDRVDPSCKSILLNQEYTTTKIGRSTSESLNRSKMKTLRMNVLVDAGQVDNRSLSRIS